MISFTSEMAFGAAAKHIVQRKSLFPSFDVIATEAHAEFLRMKVTSDQISSEKEV